MSERLNHLKAASLILNEIERELTETRAAMEARDKQCMYVEKLVKLLEEDNALLKVVELSSSPLYNSPPLNRLTFPPFRLLM